jgi:hypothetical protein
VRFVVNLRLNFVVILKFELLDLLAKPGLGRIFRLKGESPIKKTNKPEQGKLITWHTAFFDAIRLDLYPYRDVLSFEFEHPLNSEPLRIDVVIVKKASGVRIEKPIGTMFRGVNIIEYKSPEDHLSVQDFHKVGAYARLYSVLNEVEIRDMTISFVVEAHPRKLLEYLREVYQYKVRETWPGIYHVEGEILGIQIVESKRLGGEEGIWLKDLRSGLDGERLRRLLEEGKRMPEGAPLSAYMYTVLRANVAGLREVLEMSDATFEEVLEEFGLAAKWEAKGREEGREEAVKRLQKYGMEPEQIALALELSEDAVFRYLSEG